MNDIRIATLVPTYADISPKVYRSHINALLVSMKKGYQIAQLGLTEKELLCHARNSLIEAFMGSNCTHALCLDADVALPPHAVASLVEAKKDMITGIYYQKAAPYYPVIMTRGVFKGNKDRKHQFFVKWPENTIFPIDACGFGCILIKREVFEKIKYPWFAWTEKSGEDIDFCMKVKKKGIDIFCHSGVVCGHVGSKEFTAEDFNSQEIKNTRKIKIADGVYAEEVESGINIRQ